MRPALDGAAVHLPAAAPEAKRAVALDTTLGLLASAHPPGRPSV
ncbi:hypothetical protein [Streptomyces sp. NBC_01235]|nr:hypothetical protein OG289_44670 [Streptomyces sp. NBC_01235]